MVRAALTFGVRVSVGDQAHGLARAPESHRGLRCPVAQREVVFDLWSPTVRDGPSLSGWNYATAVWEARMGRALQRHLERLGRGCGQLDHRGSRMREIRISPADAPA